MFRVENADFIADKLAAELLPNQEFREVLKNALEAVERRMKTDGSSAGGRIEFDVDWHLHQSHDSRPWFLSCSDNGDGMSRSELERYTTTLAVQGAGGRQSLRGNQGMGLKISGPTRHRQGILIRSKKGAEQTMVQIGWNDHEYGLIPIGQNNELVTSVSSSHFPDFVNQQGAGTVVTFLGNSAGDNTFAPLSGTKTWLLKYLNTRFFRLSRDGVEVIVRVPSGDSEEWPDSLEEARERMKKKGKSFNLTRVDGTGILWDEASDLLGTGYKGVVSLPGDLSASIPAADVHWWVHPEPGSGKDVSSRTASAGSLAILFDNELHDWRTRNQANPFFARMGVLFGKNRISFVLEPKGELVSSDFARAHVLVGGRPAFETDAWLVWTDQFRSLMPDCIRRTMADEQARLEEEDPDRTRRIKDRLREVMDLLRPRRFRPKNPGSVRAAASVTGAGNEDVGGQEQPIQVSSSPRSKAARGRGIGAVLAQLNDEGEPAAEVLSALQIEPMWVSEQEADGMAIVSGNQHGIRDRAAALAGTDGRTASILLLNRTFRGFQTILAAMNDWANPEGDEDKGKRIQSVAEEWVEQKMIEAVQGLRQLENGNTWITQHYDEALSPVSLTAAFMADRYHTLTEVKRAIGPLRQPQRATQGS